MTRYMRGKSPAPAKLNYKWWANGLDGGVYETPEAPDEHQRVHSTFTDARRALGDYFDARAKDADAARHRARQLRKADLKDGEVTI
jgi:hypothetical protein